MTFNISGSRSEYNKSKSQNRSNQRLQIRTATKMKGNWKNIKIIEANRKTRAVHGCGKYEEKLGTVIQHPRLVRVSEALKKFFLLRVTKRALRLETKNDTIFLLSCLAEKIIVKTLRNLRF